MYFLRRRNKPLIITIDTIGGAYSKVKRVFVKPKKLEKDKIKKILVLSLDLIGDGILATPAFRTLRENFPDAEITALAGQWNKQIFENNPDIDKVEIISPFWTRSNDLGFWQKIREYLKIRGSVKKDDYDLGIDLRGEFLSIWLMKKMGVKYTTGYGITGGRWLLDKCAYYEGNRFAKHVVERNLDLLRALGLKISDNLDLAIYPKEENKQAVDKFFSENKISKDDKIAVIHPSSNDQARCWDNGRWAEVAERLVEEGYRVVLSGGPGDVEVIKSIRQLAESKVESLLNINPESRIPNPEKTLVSKSVSDFGFRISDFLGYSILDLAELIKRADLLLCVNSAALHIGAATETPTVVLFAGSYPKTYGPWPAYNRRGKPASAESRGKPASAESRGKPASSRGKQNLKSVVLFKDAPCFPCGKSVCENNVCMRDITVEEVENAVTSLKNKV